MPESCHKSKVQEKTLSLKKKFHELFPHFHKHEAKESFYKHDAKVILALQQVQWARKLRSECMKI
jgi:hypothetical protein